MKNNITDGVLQVTSKISDGCFLNATLLLIFALQEHGYNTDTLQQTQRVLTR